MEVGDRPLKAQRVFATGHIRDGHTKTRQGNSTGRYVGHVLRHDRCVSSRTHPGRVSKIPVFRSGEQKVHVPCAPLRPQHGAMGLHRNSETNQGMVSGTTQDSVSILRRLAQPVPRIPRSINRHQGTSETVRNARLDSERQEVGTNSSTEHSVPGRALGFREPQSFPDIGTPIDHSSPCAKGDRTEGPLLSRGGVPHGASERDGSDDPSRPPQSSTTSTTSDSSGQDGPRPQGMGSSGGAHSPPIIMVASPATLAGRNTIPPFEPSDDSVHGCLDERMGRSVQQLALVGDMDSLGSHQLARTANSVSGAAAATISHAGQIGTFSHRQCDDNRVHSETRRNEIQSPHVPHGQDLDSGSQTSDHDHTATHSGSEQRAGGHGLQGRSGDFNGVDPHPTGVRLAGNDIAVGDTISRAIRESNESHSTQVRLPMPRPRGLGDRCDDMQVATGNHLRISTSPSDMATDRETSGGGELQSFTGNDVVRSGEMDTGTVRPPNSSDSVLPATPATAMPAALGTHAPSQHDGSETDMFGEAFLKKQGFSDRVIARIQSSRATSTRKHYRSQWELFVAWATERKLDPMGASLPLLAEFLEYLFKIRKVAVRTIANYKSAVLFHWKAQCGFEFPENDTVIRDLLKGFKREKPIPHKHVVDWDVRLVLSYFQSGRFRDWGQLSDRDLTLKTVFLVALATGKRRSELHALSRNVRWIRGKGKSVELSPVPEFISKTQIATAGLGALRPITLQSLDEMAGPEGKGDKLLCPVRALAYYLDRSSHYRSSEQRLLFISYRRGMVKDIARQTLSAYIKEAIMLAYQSKRDSDNDLGIHVKAHSVRHVATSLSALRHYSIDDVLKAGAWTTPNVFLNFYIQDFTIDSMSNLSRLGGFVAAGTLV